MGFKRFYKKATQDYVQIKKIAFPKLLEELVYQGKDAGEVELPKIYLKNEKGYLPDFLTGGTSILVCSDKVKRFLECSSESPFLQFLETQIVSKTISDKYFMINILNPIECLDRENSIYDVAPENPDVIINLEKMIINKRKTNGRKLFNMKEVPIEIYIKESFANQMNEAGIHDIRLLPLVGHKS